MTPRSSFHRLEEDAWEETGVLRRLNADTLAALDQERQQGVPRSPRTPVMPQD